MTMTDERDDRPRPGPNKPVPACDEYEQLEQAVNNYLNHEPDDPSWNDIWRALAAIMGEYQRDAFVDAFDLAQPAETPCVRRLITGEEECTCHEKRGWEQRELETIGARDDPPHAPPYRDHAMLWLDESGDPAVYGMHVYPGNVERLESEEPPHNLWFDLFEFTAEWGLEVSIRPKSWHNLGTTVHVVFYPPERYR